MSKLPKPRRLEGLSDAAFSIIITLLAGLAAVAWLVVHPILAAALFTFVVPYHAWTSQGIPSGR